MVLYDVIQRTFCPMGLYKTIVGTKKLPNQGSYIGKARQSQGLANI